MVTWLCVLNWEIEGQVGKTSLETHQECSYLEASDDLLAINCKGIQQSVVAAVILFEARKNNILLTQQDAN